MKFIKLKQGFSTFDLMTTISSLVAVAAVSLPIVHRSMLSRDSDIARQEIRKISESLAGIDAHLSQKANRSTASVVSKDSALGVDPWGHPYGYRYLSNAYGQPAALLVYSSGPNGVLDTQGEINRSTLNENFAFKGDDIGYVKSLR